MIAGIRIRPAKIGGSFLSEKGFTLIELMISVAALAVAILGVGNVIVNAARSSAIARKNTMACNLCQAKIEALKALGYNALANANSQESNINEKGEQGGYFTRTVTATNGPLPDTKLITVTVSWTDLFGPRTVSLQTMVANL